MQNPMNRRLVSVLGNTDLSVLELLEYGLSIAEVNYAFFNNIIEYLRIPRLNESKMQNLPQSHDFYYYSVRKKVKLTGLGLYILDNIETSPVKRHVPPESNI